MKAKLVCHPDGFSLFCLMNVKEIEVGGRIHELCVFKWDDYSGIYYYIGPVV